MQIFTENVQKYTAAVAALEAESRKLSTYRLMVFVLSAIVITLLANVGQAEPVIVLTPLCIGWFTWLIKRHNRVDKELQDTLHLKELNEQEVQRQENTLSGLPTGEDFQQAEHPYAADLDIFGSHSLYQQLNRATTESGAARLAEWLSAPADRTVILERQAAVQELTPRMPWRQAFQASGMGFYHTGRDYATLIGWVTKPARLLPRKGLYMLAAVVLGIAATAAAVYFFSHVLIGPIEEITPFTLPLVVMLFINNLVLRKVKPIAEEIATSIQHTVKIVSAYQVLSAKIESESFQSPLLRGLQAAFRTDEYSAAVEIGKLRKILDVLQSRGSKRQFNNMFYGILNNLLFIDIYLVLAVESWNSKNATRLATWSDTVGEFEALCSLAGFAYANPAFNYPEIADTPHVISFDAIGHPLLPATRRICNDFNLRGRGDMAMITGSNMAGKSTFLRTVGINIVLALTGAPCCAQQARVSHMQVFTSMRTQDNLEEGVSSFYAELKRIAQLLKLIESGRPLFFMLDEMFKGTNSKDRHRGGFSLIRQLRELNAFGMISTHDLDLATLTEKHTLVTNYSFNSTMEGDRLVFSYRLTPGLCKDFNASELMRQNGIKILSDVDL
jgi:hypothetical protein